MNTKAIAGAVVIGSVAGTVGIFLLLWYAADRPVVLVLYITLGGGIVSIVYRASKSFVQQRSARMIAAGLGVLLALGVIGAPVRTDRGSSWNEAMKAARVLKTIVHQNEEYAMLHQGSFAHNLAELGITSTIGKVYTIKYNVMEDEHHIVRRYNILATPENRYQISLYASENGIVRYSSNGNADESSSPLF